MSATQLADIFGQEQAIHWLRQSYLADRLSHALLFAGPEGVGKATTAAALGRLFLCEQPRGDRSCGTCDSCRVFDAGNHPDFHVITRELIRYHDKTGKSKGIELSIQVLRPELIEPAGRKPAMGTGKVFVIEQAQAMNAQAQNALLKTLEEPLGRTLIVLLTDQPGALLATIRSRCQMVRFAALGTDLVERELVQRGVEQDAARDAARVSRGSLGTAMKWTQDGVVAPARELAEIIDGLFAGEQPADLPGWFKSAADAYAGRQLERDPLASKDQATREGLTLYLLLAGEQIRQRLHDGADAAEAEAACGAIEALVRAETYLDANVNISLVFQQLSIKLWGLAAR